jgi:hypothetical protein
VLGPLSLTNLLWFNSIERVGPSRASLYANLQPFLGAIFALLILSESITTLQVGGGVLIAAAASCSRDVSSRRFLFRRSACKLKRQAALRRQPAPRRHLRCR